MPCSTRRRTPVDSCRSARLSGRRARCRRGWARVVEVLPLVEALDRPSVRRAPPSHRAPRTDMSRRPVEGYAVLDASSVTCRLMSVRASQWPPPSGAAIPPCTEAGGAIARAGPDPGDSARCGRPRRRFPQFPTTGGQLSRADAGSGRVSDNWRKLSKRTPEADATGGAARPRPARQSGRRGSLAGAAAWQVRQAGKYGRPGSHWHLRNGGDRGGRVAGAGPDSGGWRTQSDP